MSKLNSVLNQIKQSDKNGKGKAKKKTKLLTIMLVATVIILAIAIPLVFLVENQRQTVEIVIAYHAATEWIGELAEPIDKDTSESVAGKVVYGTYPQDHTLRLKQEMMEISDQVGSLYGISGKLVLAVAMVETNAYSIPNLERGQSGSLYTDLCLGYEKAADGKLFFVDSDTTGNVVDKNGIIVKDPLRVGKLREDYNEAGVRKAIGPYQFYSTYVQEHVTRMYTGSVGAPSQQTDMEMMSYFDAELGFMRPHPLYFPDAALNAAAKLKADMENHRELVTHLTNTPEQIKDEILFIYASDAYHGDMAVPAKGEHYKKLHDSINMLYADIFSKYSADGIISTSLGDFSKPGYNQAAVRAALGGTQFTTNGNIDFDGTYDHDNKAIKSDETGKYVEFGGVRLYKPMVTELSNSTAYNLDYQQLLIDAPAGTSSGTNNKFGWVYGFQGLNAATYYWDSWELEIKDYNTSIDQNYFGQGDFARHANIIEDAYPIGDYTVWVTGDIQDTELNGALLGRLAKLAEDYNSVITVLDGFRSIEDQEAMRKSYLAKGGFVMNADGSVSGMSNRSWKVFVAAPGKSRHQLGLAVDVERHRAENVWIGQIGNAELLKYGLHKPMGHEPWHIEPIETGARR